MSEKREKQSDKSGCPECGGSIIVDNETGEYICRQCGVVISSNLMNREPEWKSYDPSQRNSLPRVGVPMNLMIHDKGLSTNISWRNRDAYGRVLDKETQARLYRLRKWQQRSKVSDNYNRNLNSALNILQGVQSKLNLPRNVIETSSQIYRNALKSSLVRGRTIKCVSAACTYMACRKCGVIRNLDDISIVFNLPRKEVARNYRFLIQHFGSTVPQVDPSSLIGNIMSKLGLYGVVEKLANSILECASEKKLTVGRGPPGMAAACVYISAYICGYHITQGMISKVAQVTEVTMRNRYKELLRSFEIIVQI